MWTPSLWDVYERQPLYPRRVITVATVGVGWISTNMPPLKGRGGEVIGRAHRSSPGVGATKVIAYTLRPSCTGERGGGREGGESMSHQWRG